MKKSCFLAGVLISLSLISCSAQKLKVENRVKLNVAAEEKLTEHSGEFEKRIYKIADNVYSAVGYGLANSIMIEGEDGLIIVDTMESIQEAGVVFEEFRKISDKPVKAIIYTHNHVDHIMGAAAMTGGGDPDVYAHTSTDIYVQRLLNKMRPIIGTRSMRMFGNYLGKEELVNSGIGPFLGISDKTTSGYLRPTVTFEDSMEIMVAGEKIKLIHASGETNDQIYVYLPEKGILLCGDNYYKSFPNLYTIRGTPFRSLKSWYKSVDIIRDIKPEYLVPSHSRPLTGADKIYTIMTNYRDAIQYIHDQGIRGINQGMTPDELVAEIRLPNHLSSLPYLQEFYGKVSWSLRSLFSGNIGWFSGDSADLQPLSRKKEAKMMEELAGGPDRLLEKAKIYSEKGEYQAALQLSGHILRLDSDNRDARKVRIDALIALGSMEENANARHYYLTEAVEIREEKLAVENIRITAEQLAQIPLEGFLSMMAVSLDGEAAADIVKTTWLRFVGEDSEFTIIVRRGVAEIREGLAGDPDIIVKTDAADFKAMLAKIKNPVAALAGFEYEKGNPVSFGRFLRMFEPPVQKLAYQPLIK